MRSGGTDRVYFRDSRVPAENLIGPEHGGALVFNQMMIPERMTSAAGALGVPGRPWRLRVVTATSPRPSARRSGASRALASRWLIALPCSTRREAP
jgi:alkylation response protein AidB-like acyl-CoA dehydrogenase